MLCKICKEEKAVIKTIHGSFCESCFISYFEYFLQKVIRKYKMFKKKDKILVAVSGGKDSNSLAYALFNLGYDFDLLFIDLKIPNFSENSKQAVLELKEKIGVDLIIEDIEKYKIKIERVGMRPECSVCGIVKRYLMNKIAYENGYDVLVTGHNLSDFMAFFLGNLLNGNIDLLIKLDPVREKEGKFVKKVSPLFLFYDHEVKLYADINNVPYYEGKCPYAKDVPQKKMKKIIDELEKMFPFISYHCIKKFLKWKNRIVRIKKEYKECKICGYPTEGEICSFCRIRMYFE